MDGCAVDVPRAVTSRSSIGPLVVYEVVDAECMEGEDHVASRMGASIHLYRQLYGRIGTFVTPPRDAYRRVHMPESAH